MNKSIFPAFILICAIFLGLIVSTGCANIIPPSGGPKDSLPPRLIRASPRDSALNFKGNNLTLTFDEYIDLQNVQKELIISPVQERNPIVNHKLKTIMIKLIDTLEENVTYSFNFGEAIKDINEGNILKKFNYFFSTGPYLDTLTITGKVIIAETGKVDSTLLVMLHKTENDSVVINSKPRYITRVNNKGEFKFSNLPEGIFYLYAIKDETGIGKLLGKNQLFAFSDRSISTREKPDSQMLNAYLENIFIEPIKIDEKEKFLNPTNNLRFGLLDIFQDFDLQFNTPINTFDTSKISFSSDSAHNPITNFKWIADSAKTKYTLSTKWDEGKHYHLIFDKNYAKDTLNKTNEKIDTISFYVRKKSDYGSVRIKFKDLDLTENHVLQFMIGNTIEYSFPLNSLIFKAELFKPGEYGIRILKDDNKNGRWDTGDFFNGRKQPEQVKYIDRKLTIKANWENDFEIDVRSIIK